VRDDAVHLKHIRDSIAKVETYTAAGQTAFFQDTMVQDAVIRNLEVIGEAVRDLSPEFKRQHPELPWRSISALRNVLVHEYFGVDLKATEIVWRIVQRQLPALKLHIEAFLDRGEL
jgi:uncharacterized protein with HEPN domain